ncbi:MAG: 50S ribosomal protein L6 [Alphaproteobacteria bacterium MarineAlpha5_Bin5]|nr:MAG: 50S ribosomal protein L6 [Alphaproteobacteria bacterium MarineAlpha5_Bin4]PPR50793.1 MAG: 50S ribosomal protein L6 [Alphaproteobacteria bacterium MarineAlpha5_Bin5]|tara:strand:- start:3538 stop:4071 length:534 start_codon:yes stop_codon:yes gene_type:complete
MSRIAKNSIKINKEINCKFENGLFFAKGKLGEKSLNINSSYTVEINNEEILILPKDEKDKLNPSWGTTRALVANLIQGVSDGFSKTLELNGTGYRASISGSKLKLQVGYSHDIDYEIPKEVKVECPKQNIIKLYSFDKEVLGATAAKIRSYRKPEPFKGKGIKYENEFIFRKEGKKK